MARPRPTSRYRHLGLIRRWTATAAMTVHAWNTCLQGMAEPELHPSDHRPHLRNLCKKSPDLFALITDRPMGDRTKSQYIPLKLLTVCPSSCLTFFLPRAERERARRRELSHTRLRSPLACVNEPTTR